MYTNVLDSKQMLIVNVCLGREREYSDNLSTSSGSSHSVPRVQSFDIRAENVLVFPDHT